MARGKNKKEVYDFIAAGTALGINAKLLSSVCGMSPGSVRQARHTMGIKWRNGHAGAKHYKIERNLHWLAPLIAQRMAEKKITKYKLSKLAHVGKASLYGLLQGRSGMQIESIERILKVLDLKLTTTPTA